MFLLERTGGGLADGGVHRTELIPVHTHTPEAAVCVDAALSAGERAGTLVHVHARFPIILQSEPGVTAALRGESQDFILFIKSLTCAIYFNRKDSSQGFDLEADFHVLAELRAAAQFTVQTLVQEAVELVSAVAAVVFTVTQQRLGHALPVPARVRRIVTFLLWFVCFCFFSGRKKNFLNFLTSRTFK